MHLTIPTRIRLRHLPHIALILLIEVLSTTLDKVIRMRDNGISPEFVADMKEE